MASSRSSSDSQRPHPILIGPNPALMARTPPPAAQRRRSSRVPGGFDTDEELSPMKVDFGDEGGYDGGYITWDEHEKKILSRKLFASEDAKENKQPQQQRSHDVDVDVDIANPPPLLSSQDEAGSAPPLSPRQRQLQPMISARSDAAAAEEEEEEDDYYYPSSSSFHPTANIIDDYNDSSSILLPSAFSYSDYNAITMDDSTNNQNSATANDYNNDEHGHDHHRGHDYREESYNDDIIHNDLTLSNQTALDEKEMRQKLMDMESSFLPEPSTIGVAATPGLPAPDDTYLVGVDAAESSQVEEGDSRDTPPSPSTPPGAYKTPAARRAMGLDPSLYGEEEDTEEQEYAHGHYNEETADDATPSAKGNDTTNTSALETISSSPTAAAAARTVSRAVSTALSNSSLRSSASQRREHAERDDSLLSSTDDDNPDSTRRSARRDVSQTRAASQQLQDGTGVSGSEGDTQHSLEPSSERRRKRPKFLTSRQSAHRFSASSIATAGTDTASSEAAMGVDFAIQSGGAAPANNNSQSSQGRGRQKRVELTRTISLGSMASGVSGMSDDPLMEQKRGFSGVSDASLHTLDEEDSTSQARPESSGKSATDPMTPKASARDHSEHPLPPPDTAIAEHIKDISIPTTLSRQLRETIGLSPDKRGGAPTPAFGRSGKSLTLKEQSSTIDRLSKENFDLKMRIHFLNEALNKRSEEGVKEMISENVELKSDKMKLQKDNQALRRNIRELEKQLKDRGDGVEGEGAGAEGSDEESQGHGGTAGTSGVDEEELTYLRERVETYEVEIERLRSESISREGEKRRLAEMVKSLGEGRVAIGSDAGAREERDMWKDMLDAETAAREQAEEENRKLRDEILRMKTDAVSGSRSGGSRIGKMSSVVSRSTASDRNVDRSVALGTSSSATLVELELLKQENAELRREVSAQTSMLTSRNREKERLYQEIEDLKLGQRRGDGGRSVAGDSIFERSVSRAAQGRSNSRTSDGARSRASVSDTEKETLEVKNGQLRDQVSTLKLENQNLQAQLDECMTDLEALDRAYQADIEQAEEDLQTMQLERDQALQLAEEREEALQDLKAEAQEELDAMGDELDQKIDEAQRMEVELANQHENLNALQAEMRSASEGIIRLEEDAQHNLQKYKAVQQELDDANRELEQMERSLFEANSKVQRLTVQQESSQNEIAFLREEQDGDKIKIGDLESELKTCQMSLQSEKDKTKELVRRLAEERHQREVVDSKEKQDVQRMMNELNRENSASRDEVRKLKKNLSAREIEATTWKERLMELENSLREALGDLNGTRSSLLASILKLQQELDSTALELESTRTKLGEKESLLRNRDALLESHGLETRKLADLLERERQAHRADKHSFEQSLKSQYQASRTISQNNSRISDLEAARNQDRKRFGSLEQQHRDQLNERNAMFLTIWKRLSAMCGPDWAHSNSLINGNLPSQEVIGNILFWPGFTRNLLLAVKTVENLISGFKTRIKNVERELTKDYHNLEHNLNIRVKRLERMEESLQHLRANQQQHLHYHRRSTSSTDSPSPELAKLRGENRLLKAEINLLQSHSRARIANTGGSPRNSSRQSASNIAANTLSRYSSTTAIDTVSSPNGQAQAPSSTRSPSTLSRGSSGIPQPSHYSSSTTLNNNPASTSSASTQIAAPQQSSQYHHNSSSSHRHSQPGSEPSQEKWIKRLHELERRLTAEREARLLDRSGARKRLEEQNARNEELQAELARQKVRKQLQGSQGQQGAIDSAPHTGGSSGSGSGNGNGPTAPSRHLSSASVSVSGDEAERLRARRERGHERGQRHHRRSNHGSRSGTGTGTDEDFEDHDYDDGRSGTGTGTGTDDGEGESGGGFTVEVEV
ncbi:hypothetical protein AJ79_04196 [Helicocarpus griseus UAMH5409]|uniref:Anucleate primary sterigmata protein B n=1 Tax=Helicocarpus griseus UAMH5409 TaxID=1447875 RepID=A0A2B7XUG0_9EURO|nr:hypothetical protein AJ79_04196 [Helicocarpus griseus UAMH5409]